MGTVATLLDEHVSFRCTSVDRIGIRGYVRDMQHEFGLVKFLLNRAGGTIPSPRCSIATTSGSSASSRSSRPAPGCPSCASRRESPKRTWPVPTKTRRWPPVGPDWCWWARPRNGPQCGAATSTPPTPGIVRTTPTSPGVASPRCPTTGTSTSRTPSGVRRSSRSAPTPPTRCGAVPTGTNGPSASWPSPASTSRPSTTGCAALRTPPRPSASAPASAPAISAGSSPA